MVGRGVGGRPPCAGGCRISLPRNAAGGPSELVDFLAPFPDEVQELALGLRERVLTVMPNAHEFVWDATNAVSLAYTPTIRWQDSVVHIASYAEWVNLGFNEGASLDDPLGILFGTGAHIVGGGIAEGKRPGSGDVQGDREERGGGQ